MKEIWFGTYFFENGKIMPKFQHFQGIDHPIKVKAAITW
jgi:hypothetical protein